MTMTAIRCSIFLLLGLATSLAAWAVDVSDQPAQLLFGEANGFRLAELRPHNVKLAEDKPVLTITAQAGEMERGVVLPLTGGGSDCSSRRYVETTIVNRGSQPVEFTFWAMSGQGWGGVSTFSTTRSASGRETLAPGQKETYRIDLHARYSGRQVYMPAIDPAKVRWLELVFENPKIPVAIEMGDIQLTGLGPKEKADTSQRLLVPDVANETPAPAKRVWRTLPGWQKTEVRHVLTLPHGWQPGRHYPVLVEYTGNRFYHKFCYSTGRTADGHMVYGLANGGDYICLNLPFISGDGQHEQIDGWGDIDRAIDYCLAAVTDACGQFGGDSRAIVYVGFSRGAYAGNYLALRNDRIATLWAGFLTLRSPGAPWKDERLGWRKVGEGWNERAARMHGRPWFNSPPELGDEVHADVEYLEDRPSTLATRKWLAELVGKRMEKDSPESSRATKPASP